MTYARFTGIGFFNTSYRPCQFQVEQPHFSDEPGHILGSVRDFVPTAV